MIDIKDLHKSFDGNHVLRGVNLNIERGETMVIIGRSGCGKSVLLKHIIGLIKPDSGSIRIDGHEITTMGRNELYQLRLKFGMLFQGAALFDSLSVAENVGFLLLEHSNYDEEKIGEIVMEKLRMVRLPDEVYWKKPAELSGGQKKRVGLARAIAYDPEIILYDEPTSGLDPVMSRQVDRLIIKLRQELQVTSVVVTHDMESAYLCADRIGMLYEGRMLEVGTPEQIRNSNNKIVRAFISGGYIDTDNL